MWMDRESVERAVRIQRTGYRFLKWLESALERGFVEPEAAAGYAAEGAAAREWIERHWANLPPEARPERDEVEDFANYFTTYVDGSFTLDADPGEVLFSDHCNCPFCSWMVRRKHLRPARTLSGDKKRARTMQGNYVAQLALDLGLECDASLVEALCGRSDLRAAIGLATYAADLQRRMRGFNEGAAALVLWRTFAWDEHGSPKRNFELTADEAWAAQDAIARELKASCGATP